MKKDKSINAELKDNDNESKNEKIEQSVKIEEKAATQELTLPKIDESQQDIVQNEEKTLDAAVDKNELVSKTNELNDDGIETQTNSLNSNNDNEFVTNDGELKKKLILRLPIA